MCISTYNIAINKHQNLGTKLQVTFTSIQSKGKDSKDNVVYDVMEKISLKSFFSEDVFHLNSSFVHMQYDLVILNLHSQVLISFLKSCASWCSK